MNMPSHQRKHPVHGVKEIHNQSTIVLVTTCPKDRRINLANDVMQHMLYEIWCQATGWCVGAYMIMPDHLHYFVTLGSLDISLERWSQYWKSQLAKQHPAMRSFWLPDHWDTRIRTIEHYHEKLVYLAMNPVRKNLVGAPEDWPYQGCIFDFHWYQC